MSKQAKNFKEASDSYSVRKEDRAWIRKALSGYEIKRDENKNRFRSWSHARDLAAEIKTDAIDHLDTYLQEFIEKISARGAKVILADHGADACEKIAEIVARHNASLIVKSKSMTTEEIHLNPFLEKKGFTVVETDLGEFIVQLRDEPPYHLVFPAMHLKRDQISAIFEEKLGSQHTDSPEALTMIARTAMRQKYCQADIGITGVNFAVAETGMISVTENEGNARLTTALPKVHIALMGIEKILPRMEHLALFLPMLATAGAGQGMTGYNTLMGGPRQPGEVDGPEEMYVIILDNGRTQLLADGEQRDALHCIRCGACLNVCPIFKNIGGHSYGTTYQGPIGSVITPHLRGLLSWKHLSFASSLCGACTEACPVKIDLHHHLLRGRRNSVQVSKNPIEAVIFWGFSFLMRRPSLYVLGSRLGAIAQGIFSPLLGSIVDPFRAWTGSRDLPKPPKQSFHQYWKSRSHEC